MSLCGESSETLNQVIAATARLRSVTQALLLGATAALEAKRAGSGRTALRDRARLGSRNAKRTAEVSEQFARMPNVARGLSMGDLTPEHVEVLAEAARRTSPEAVDTAVELLEAAAQVAPEVLRRDAQDFAARHDPDSVRTVLDRQRRERSAALFIDERTGMGVLNAKFDPVSFALVQQAVENYNDALWRLDGGRDGTPRQVRDNRQRLADSVFEILTDRNALATIEHPAAQAPNTAPAHTSNAEHDRGDDRAAPDRGDAEPHRRDDRAAPDHTSNAEHDVLSVNGHGHHGDTEPHRRDDRAAPDHTSNAEHDVLSVTGHGHHGDAEPHRGDDRAGPARGSGAVVERPAGRSIERWRAAQAPNQLIIVAEIGVIDGTKPDGCCDMLGAGPVPPSILNQLSPDTRISGALFNTAGQPLWLGRSRRLASVAQRLAIAIRDRGCVLCRAPMHRCNDHHIDEWQADNGTTDIPNLAALCGDCHDKLHNNNQRLHQHHATRQWAAKPRTDNNTGTSRSGTTHTDAASAASDRDDTTRRRTTKPRTDTTRSGTDSRTQGTEPP